MDGQIRRLALAFLVLFLLLFFQINYLQVFAAHDLANNSGGHDAAYEDGVVFYLPGPDSPVIHSSPTEPTGRSDPSSETTFTSHTGTGTPTESGRSL